MILANIARKVDRIESGKDTPDETQADTAQDLMVYLAKYRSWLAGGQGDPHEVKVILRGLVGSSSGNDIINSFSVLEKAEEPSQVLACVDDLLIQAYTLALNLWQK